MQIRKCLEKRGARHGIHSLSWNFAIRYAVSEMSIRGSIQDRLERRKILKNWLIPNPSFTWRRSEIQWWVYSNIQYGDILVPKAIIISHFWSSFLIFLGNNVLSTFQNRLPISKLILRLIQHTLLFRSLDYCSCWVMWEWVVDAEKPK